MRKANYTNSNVNDLPEGIHFSKISNKWVVRVKEIAGTKERIVSIGQHKDKEVAEKMLANHLAKSK